MKPFALLSLALLGAALARAQGAPASDAAAALDLARQNAQTLQPTQRVANAARFLALMDRLGRAPAPVAADSSPEAEVTRVARARALQPEIVAELEQEYVMQYDRRSRTQAAYLPREEHLGEPYRYAWEWLLLRAKFLDGAPGYGLRALQALARIHDDASLPLIVRLCEGTAEAYQHGLLDESQVLESNLANLAAFRSVRGLEALVACAAAVERAQGGDATEPGKGVRIGKILRRALRPPEGRPPVWHEAETEYRRDPAHREGAHLLDRLLAEPAGEAQRPERPRRTPPPSGG